jgi:large subunit ribosomal protein L1
MKNKMLQNDVIKRTKCYSLDSIDLAIKKAKELSIIKNLKFKESVDLAINLNLGSKQSIKGSVILPNGSGKTSRIIVLTESEEQQKLAIEAGAIMSGLDNLVLKIEEGFVDFDYCIATQDVMHKISRLAKKLGPRGLMPSQKNGTITNEITKSVSEFLGGKVSFKSDKFGIVHCLVGKSDFKEESLTENTLSIIKAVKDLKPDNSKGRFIKSLYLKTTMGSSIKVSSDSL